MLKATQGEGRQPADARYYAVQYRKTRLLFTRYAAHHAEAQRRQSTCS